MKIEYSKKFIKEFKKCPNNIKSSFKIRIHIFLENNNAPILNNHELIGEFKNYRSINITGDWRAIFKIIENDETAHFVAIGTHSKLYS